MNTTAGDLLAKDVACRWLQEAGYPYDVALAPAFGSAVDYHAVDPSAYTHLLFVCGPFRDTKFIRGLMEPFAGCRRIGLNLSMLTSLQQWNPFELLLERDSERASRPDITFGSLAARVPVVGQVLVHPQHEYGAGSLRTGKPPWCPSTPAWRTTPAACAPRPRSKR
jgi:hypothetical protein